MAAILRGTSGLAQVCFGRVGVRESLLHVRRERPPLRGNGRTVRAVTGLFIALGVMLVVLVAIVAKVFGTPDPKRRTKVSTTKKRRRSSSSDSSLFGGVWAGGGDSGGSSCGGGSSSCGGGGGGGCGGGGS
ncbi:hypothetical protein GCM10018987_26860 [Streptomyces cremeus]